ncbi:MAG: arylsulfatase [Akkermansiaceae bacterium]|jgi:arylsulfatase|nr:arylsulfatase [Akkermansiaceae bacterium]
MNRSASSPLRYRLVRTLTACSATMLLAAVTPLVAAEAPPAKPNIILVITDDQGYPVIGRHGHPWIRTPHLDALHDTSARFSRFLVSPTCSPTRSALMTGRHPLKNGVTHTINERDRMTLDAVTLPQVLKTAGYTSGIFGKWHLGDEDAYQPGQRGFDEVFIHGAGGIGQAYDCSNADAPNNKYHDPVIRHNGTFKQTRGFCTDVFFSAALGWIHAQAEAKRPFFAYIPTNAPHGPFIAPEKNAARFLQLGFGKEQAGFYGMIENIDENIGRLMAHLEQSKLLSNTVVIFMSDNGMTGGGSGKPGKPLAKGYPFFNAGMKGLKGSADEGGVRVPFFIRWDGRIPAGREVDRIAAHIDILPTLAALAGAQPPAGQVEGRSLLPLLLGGTPGDWPDRYLFTHQGRWPVGSDPDEYQWQNFAVRNQRFRLVGRGELYDMINDPGQTTNVAAEHPDVVRAMLAAYGAFWKEARPLMVNEGVPMSKTRPYHEAFRKQQQEQGIPQWQPTLP